MIPSALEAVATRIISADIKMIKLDGVSRETMGDAPKSLSIRARVLAKRSITMWDILPAKEEGAKKLVRSIHQI